MFWNFRSDKSLGIGASDSWMASARPHFYGDKSAPSSNSSPSLSTLGSHFYYNCYEVLLELPNYCSPSGDLIFSMADYTEEWWSWLARPSIVLAIVLVV